MKNYSETPETIEPCLVKKLQISMSSDPKECVKPSSGKKTFRQCQEKILQEIEKENIQKFVEDLISKFEPPFCENCPQRRADRVCVNKNCGSNFM